MSFRNDSFVERKKSAVTPFVLHSFEPNHRNDDPSFPSKTPFKLQENYLCRSRIRKFRIWICSFLYPDLPGSRTVRLGPHTVLKVGAHVDTSEAETMTFVALNTTIPIPKVHRVYTVSGRTSIEMEFIRGREAGEVWHTLSSEQRRSILAELEGYIRQLRSLQPPDGYPEVVSSINGGPCRDHRFGMYPAGPFATHAEFHKFLRYDNELDKYAENCPEIVASHSKTYASKFTHGDIASRNVLIHDGKIEAIIDWDSAGWRPEYWEVTKAYFASNRHPFPDWMDAVKKATGGEYEEQLKGESRLWVVAEFPTSPTQIF